jgi:hypothetical protein
LDSKKQGSKFDAFGKKREKKKRREREMGGGRRL